MSLSSSSQALPIPPAATHPLAAAQAAHSSTSNAEPDAAPWPNLHAPDAVRTSTSAANAGSGSQGYRALRVFLRNPTAMLGCGFLLAVLLLALWPLVVSQEPA